MSQPAVQENQVANSLAGSATRTALVTGGTRGIGAAIAAALAADSHRVAIVGRDPELLNREAAAIRDRGGEALPIQADLATPDFAEGILKRIEEQWGAVDILVNNAGINRDGLLIRMSVDDFTTVLAVNLTAAFELSRRCARTMMKARWGRIINIASVVGETGNAGQANYVASKAGLIGLTKSMALELASRNITVNAIAPGFIETDMTGALPEAVRQKYLEKIPLGRFGSAGDVGSLVAFLASPRAAYITGQVIRVDGGLVTA
ncbi:MAG: 3-oxoacyl-[acyl-carrier-protein] reductase [Candidatus Zixiibacteriota bacterium]